MSENNADLIPQLKEVLELLAKIDRTYASERKEAINLLQQKIWDETALQDDDELYFLEELTGDLNFYEPEERYRDEPLGYYDDNKLTKVIAEARKKVESILSNTDQH